MTFSYSSYLRNIFDVVVSRGLIKIINVVILIILVRILDESDFSKYGMIVSALLVSVAVGNLGLKQSFAYYIGRNEVCKEEIKRQLLKSFMPVALFSSLVIFFITDSYFVSWLMGSAIIGAAVLFSISSVLQGVYLGSGNLRVNNIMEVLPKLVFLIFLLLLLMLKYVIEISFSIDFNFVCLMIFFSYLITCLYGYHMVSLAKFGGVGGTVRAADFLKKGLQYSVVLFLIVFNERFAVFYFTHVGDASSAGKMFALLQVNQLFIELSAAIGLVLFSHGTRNKNKKKALYNAAKLIRMLNVLLFFSVILFLPFSKMFVHVVLGNLGFEIYSEYLIFLMFLPMFLFSKIIYPALAGFGDQVAGGFCYFAALIFNMICLYCFYGEFGYLSAVIGIVGSYTLSTLLLIAHIWAKYKISPLCFVLPRSNDFKVLLTRFKNKFKGSTE